MRACWAVQGEEAPGHGFFAVCFVGFFPFRVFASLSVWFGCMMPGLYEVIQYTNTHSQSGMRGFEPV